VSVLRKFAPPCEFVETYYDTTNKDLAKANVWLKKVEDKYYLKRFAHSVHDGFAYEVQSFSTLEDVLESLTSFFPSIQISHLKPFATLPIIRYKQSLKEGVTLRFDITKLADDNYYSIGTIETTSDLDELPSLLLDLEPWISKIQYPVHSKIQEYIYLYCPFKKVHSKKMTNDDVSNHSEKWVLEDDDYVSCASINHFETFDKNLEDLPPPTNEERMQMD
jgi:hypothetical protein